MTPRAACFDLDGTLVDSEILWGWATFDYLAAKQCTPLEFSQVIGLVYGHAWSAIHKRLLEWFPAQLAGLSADQMAEELEPYYLRRRSDPASIVIPSSVACLRALAQTMPVAIVSGSPRNAINECIDIMGVRDAVSFYVGSEDYDYGKPAPDCYLMAARHFDVAPADCLVFEDSTAGIRAGKAAGMFCIGLVRPHDGPAQDLSQADLLLNDLGDFSADNLRC